MRNLSYLSALTFACLSGGFIWAAESNQEQELQKILQQRDQEVQETTALIYKRYELVLEPLLKKAIEANDTALVSKIKAAKSIPKDGALKSSDPATESAQNHLREELETIIPEAIRLLEKKEYETLLKMLVVPKDLEKLLKEEGPLEKFAAEFGKDKAPKVLGVLKSVQEKEPAMNEDKTEASYQLDESVAANSHGTLRFVKIGKYWYIEN